MIRHCQIKSIIFRILYIFALTLYNYYGDNMNPIAFSLFGYEVKWYSIMILIGALIGYFLIDRESKKFKINKDFIFNMFFWTLIIGIIGARLYYVMFSWDYYGSHVNEIWHIWEGGLAIHGGIIFGLITLSLYCKKKDIVVPSLILAQAIGRWGNFFNSEAYGAATTLEHLKSLPIPSFVINGMNINGIYYTPTFFYESMWCLLGFILLLIYRRTKFSKVGQLTALYLIWYGLGRFFIEASRTDSLIFFGFKIAQIVSIIMIIIGVCLIINSAKKSKYEDLYNDINNIEKGL